MTDKRFKRFKQLELWNNNSMNKQDWQKKTAGHRQRLRDKFLDRGINAFSDDEILELILTLGTPRKDCKEMARDALKRFGTLAKVMDASQSELEQVQGIGAKNSFAVHFIHGVARRYLEQRLEEKDYLRSSSQVADYLIHSMRDLKQEEFKAIFLDASHGIIAAQTITQGTITANTIYPRELIKKALDHNAAAMVVAHNHPSGNPKPSPEDIKLTKSLFLACGFMHIRLLDHFIVAGSSQPYSFADHGIMKEIQANCSPHL